MGESELNLVELWERYCETHDADAREQLIIYYFPLVKRVVGRLGIPETATLEYQDLVSHGVTGLLEALDRYDPSRGIAFETFASQRIRGSVLDVLRKHDYASRSVRRRAAEIERTIAELRAELNRIPTDEEIAQRLEMDLETYRDVLDQANIVFLSLDGPFASPAGEGGDMVLGETLEDTSMHDVTAQIEERDLHQELVNAIGELPEREQLVLSLYYYEELTIREVAEVMNLSPSRISQLMARSIMTLRARLIYDLEPEESRRRPLPAAGEKCRRGGRVVPRVETSGFSARV